MICTFHIWWACITCILNAPVLIGKLLGLYISKYVILNWTESVHNTVSHLFKCLNYVYGFKFRQHVTDKTTPLPQRALQCKISTVSCFNCLTYFPGVLKSRYYNFNSSCATLIQRKFIFDYPAFFINLLFLSHSYYKLIISMNVRQASLQTWVNYVKGSVHCSLNVHVLFFVGGGGVFTALSKYFTYRSSKVG